MYESETGIVINLFTAHSTQLMFCFYNWSSCNQYYSTIVYLLIIYIAIFCHGTSLKKTFLGTWGLEPASPLSVVNRHAISSRPSCIPKIASVMMWELTLDEWEKTVLLNSVLDASFFGMHDGLEDIACLLTTDAGDAMPGWHSGLECWLGSMLSNALYVRSQPGMDYFVLSVCCCVRFLALLCYQKYSCVYHTCRS